MRTPPPCLAILLVLAGFAGRPAVAGEDRPFVLPGALDNYADPDLPRHFRTPLVRRFDNTPRDNPTTDQGATLGRVLFYDTRLSADGTLSCGSCHIQSRAFSDPERFSRGVRDRRGDRNAMSLIEARYYTGDGFFWDERASTLEQQVLKPIQDRREMAHRLSAVVETIGGDRRYAPLFEDAFGDAEVSEDRIAKALAQFVRSMVSYRSKFDEGMKEVRSISDPFPNFTAQENEGKAIFVGDHDPASRGNCATCHLRGFAFRLPEDRDRQQAVFLMDRARNNGLTVDLVADDNGVGDLTLDPRDYGRFKSPSLRNVELTAPYMHDGRFATLEEVVDHYDARVQPHPNLDPQLRDPRRPGGRPGPRLMRLDREEKAALLAFLKTLTDRPFVTDPKFSDPFRRDDSRPATPPGAAVRPEQAEAGR